MTKYKSEFLNILQERGFIHQCSDFEGLDEKLKNPEKDPQSAYIGFDATASSLHVGSLVQIMMLHWFQQTGHKPITLMGGGTTKVGDPSGKDQSRKMLDDAAINANIEGIKQVFAKFLSYEDELDKNTNKAFMVNNDEWLKDINYIDFLRDYGPHFSINRMMTFDSVKLRLEREQPLTFLEFNYMILQAYDFVELRRRYDTILQMGGSDQWGNIINGVELWRRVKIQKSIEPALEDVQDEKGKELIEETGESNFGDPIFALTTPLLTTSSGAKMGKTADGAVWLNADMLSPYDYWQYWRNTEDADVGRFLKLFTTLSMDKIAELESLEGQEINEAKIILANEATKMCHGAEAAKDAAATAQKVFEQGGVGDDLPSIEIEASRLAAGIPVIDLLIEAGLATSKSEARRLIKGGGAKLNDNTIENEDSAANTASLTGENYLKLSAGKKKHALVKVA